MKKLIKVGNEVKEMSFKDVVKQYDNMLHSLSFKSNVGVGAYHMDEEDIYSELSLELWKCYNNYDVKKGICFSTLLETYAKNRIMDLGRRTKNKKEYLSEIYSDDEGKECTIFDIIGNDDEYFNNTNKLIDSIAKTDKERRIVKLLEEGYNKSEIIDTLGVSRSGFYKTFKKIQDRASKYQSTNR